ncbi:hypothetical protein CSKR_111000 [Clonorchis sinensis]|uniref:Uncharacterized protein n=1 Tax=Clonorchis sinensis TaxID=79923 RepID=A0A419PVX6_CLOSI|nr:hypothetical protein CSKR_111000 [Clonorchis sinensis]
MTSMWLADTNVAELFWSSNACEFAKLDGSYGDRQNPMWSSGSSLFIILKNSNNRASSSCSIGLSGFMQLSLDRFTRLYFSWYETERNHDLIGGGGKSPDRPGQDYRGHVYRPESMAAMSTRLAVET